MGDLVDSYRDWPGGVRVFGQCDLRCRRLWVLVIGGYLQGFETDESMARKPRNVCEQKHGTEENNKHKNRSYTTGRSSSENPAPEKRKWVGVTYLEAKQLALSSGQNYRLASCPACTARDDSDRGLKGSGKHAIHNSNMQHMDNPGGSHYLPGESVVMRMSDLVPKL